MKRCYGPHKIDNAAKIIGVDVARFGDDESALAFRQGGSQKTHGGRGKPNLRAGDESAKMNKAPAPRR
jgi:hypothetical protein